MNILAISDNVQPLLEEPAVLRRQYREIAAVISCGDLPAPYIDLIASSLDAPLFFVRGNHDTQYKVDPPGGVDLHLRNIRYNGMWLAGIEGSPRYNREPIQYTEGQMLSMVLSMAFPLLLRRLRKGAGADVFVTHAPPFDIHDLMDKPHRGFRSLRLMMRLYRPRYLIHGHVDTWDNRRPTVTQFLHTTVININPVKMLTIDPVGKGASDGL